MLNKIDHIGVAVKSIDDAIPYYENALGLKCEGIEEYRRDCPAEIVETYVLLSRRSSHRTARAYFSGQPYCKVFGKESAWRRAPYSF